MSMYPDDPNRPADSLAPPPDSSETRQDGPERASAAPDDQGPGVPAMQDPPLSRRAAWLAMGAVVLALGLLWLAPGVGDSHDEETSTSFVGMPAPLHYTLKDINGVDVKLESFKGKVILINFWATWCDPCKAEIPDLVALQDQYRDDIVVLGVEIDGSLDQVKPFATEYKMNYPVLLAASRQDFQDAFGPLYGIPVTVFVDRDGNIAKRHMLMMTKEQFEREIKGLL